MAGRDRWVFKLEAGQKRLLENHRGAYERAVFYLLILGLVLAVAGTVLGLADFGGAARLGFWALALAVVILAVSMGLSMPLEAFQVLRPEVPPDGGMAPRGFWTRLKVAGSLLHVMVILGTLFLIGALLSRLGVVDPGTVSYRIFLRAILVYALAIILVMGYSLYLSLRTPLRRRSFYGIENILLYLGLLGSVVVGLAAAVLATGALPLGTLGLQPTDAPVFILAATVLGGFALFLGRSPPTSLILLTDDRTYYETLGVEARGEGMMLPALLATTLLFIVVLSVFVFGVGVVGLFEDIPPNTVLVGVVGFVLLGVGGIVVVTMLMSRSGKEQPLYQVRRSAESRNELLIQVGSGVAAGVLLLAAGWMYLGRGFLGFPPGRWLDVFSLGLLAALGPYGFYIAAKRKRVKELEDRFPDLLRDLAASNQAGLTLNEAVEIASHGEYGELSPQIQKMADQLSWNVSFNEGLQRFADRVQTPLVERAVSLINEANSSGGNVTDVLMAAARDAREIKNLEDERRTTMVMYTAVIYITFLVFLGGVAVLYGTFIPQLVATGVAVKEAGITGFGPISFNVLTLAEYRTFFYLAALVQAVGNGIVAGLIESGSALGGMRHSFIMVATTWVIFTVVLL